MKGGLKTRGFTIIETLIVLGISAALFVMVAATLAGRQGGTEFSQAIQNIKSQIQQNISDVGAGVYDNNDRFACSAGPFGPNITASSNTQGSNTGCVFLGKVMQFKVGGTSPEQFRVYPVAGLQRDTAGNEITTYAAARPTVVSPSITSGSTPDATTTGKLQYGLTTLEAYSGTSPRVNVGAIAFVNSLASYSSGAIVSGSQQINVIPITGTALGASQAATATAINNALATSPVNPAAGVNLCFVSGSTNQSGLITIGSNGRQLAVTLKIKGNKTCA